MAKWGEGDPRWLVEHRDDGKNVNGWHWEEKDRKEWTKARLAELFSGLVLAESGEGEARTLLKVERLKDLTGDACITTRKGNKRFAVFDFAVTLGWEGSLEGATGTFKGDVRVEEVHSTGDEDDYVYSVTADGSGANQDKCRSLLQSNEVRRKVYDAIATCLRELHEQA